MTEASPSDVGRLADLIRPARRALVFSGAGISTESGIPDFRSAGGLWSRIKPITYQEFVGDEGMRREAWSRAFSGIARWTGSQPNAGHRAVAELIARGHVSCVVTQNVDNLHQDGGTPPDRVVELHGNAGYATCLACGLRHELDDLRGPFQDQGRLPACRACGGLVKTAVVSFGQSMPAEAMSRAEQAADAADLCLVLGSSLTVFPAAGLPRRAWRAGAPVVIVNRDATPLDGLATLVVREDIGPVLSAAVAAL